MRNLRVLDNTALNDFRTCRWKYYAGMVLHRRANITSSPLWYGTVVHKMLEIFYKTHDETLAIAVANKLYLGKEPNRDDYRTLARAILVFKDYVKHYGVPNPRIEETVGWPDAPAVEISTSLELDDLDNPGQTFPYAVRIDRLVRLNGLLHVEDHKTASQFGKTYFKEYIMSPQMMGYARVAELITGERIHGVRINVICTRSKDHEFARQIIPYSTARLDGWQRQTAVHVAEIASRMESGVWPRDYNCSPKYGSCTYFEVCRVPDDLQQRSLELDFTVAPWDPLSLHDED